MTKGKAALVATFMLCGFGSNLHAQVTVEDEYAQRIKAFQTISPGGETPFGERINLMTGELGFEVVDVVLDGTGPAIKVLRTSNSAFGQFRVSTMGAWNLAIPHIQTYVFTPVPTGNPGSPGERWRVANTGGPQDYERCTRFARPILMGGDFWQGFTFHDGNGGLQPLMKRATENPIHPAMTGPGGQAMVFPAVTQENWQVGCLPQTSNGELGEAFLVVSPDGTKYWLDHLVGQRAETVETYDPVTGEWLIVAPRMLATMFVSKVEDRFGNSLEYDYNGDMLVSVKAIPASSGGVVERSIAIAWDTANHRITSITAQPGSGMPRTWTYQYGSATFTVIQPDGTRWVYSGAIGGKGPTHKDQSDCDTRSGLPDSPGTNTFTVTSPTGATGTFVSRGMWHARNYVPSGCVDGPPGTEAVESVPPLFSANSLIQRTISGPGIPTSTWTYSYSPAVGSALRDPCAQTDTCPDIAWVDIVDPSGNRTRHIYSARAGTLATGSWLATEGKEIGIRAYQGTSTLLRETAVTYADADQGPWPTRLGITLEGSSTNTRKAESLTPAATRTITQQGVVFTHAVAANGFDAFAREIDATDSSTLGFSRRVQTTWHDNQADWVLGQVATRKVAGTQVERTDYNSADLPWKHWSFGKLQQTATYNPDGTLHAVTDGNSNTTTFGNWYRGIPRLITYADSTTQSATVDAHGWITSVTDGVGSKTCYAYDPMGRIKKITYPSEASAGVCDTNTWSSVKTSFVPVSNAEYGIAAGHWRQTVSTGNARNVTYFDALWRPVLVREYDTADVAGTSRFNATAYDAYGRAVHAIYPVAAGPTMSNGSWSLPGVRTTYDALGRVTAVKQDSELGVLTTTTQYLAGFKRQTTDPKDNVTTEQFQAFDMPSYDTPVQIDAPENTRTTIVRDVFGKPTSIQRGGSN